MIEATAISLNQLECHYKFYAPVYDWGKMFEHQWFRAYTAFCQRFFRTLMVTDNAMVNFTWQFVEHLSLYRQHKIFLSSTNDQAKHLWVKFYSYCVTRFLGTCYQILIISLQVIYFFKVNNGNTWKWVKFA